MSTRLTAKEESFCQEIVKGTPVAAAFLGAGYRATSLRLAGINAQRTLGRSRVSARIQELRNMAARPSILTRARKNALLAAMVEKKLLADEQLSPEQLKALEIDNRMQGHNAEEKVKVSGMGALLQKIRKKGPKP